MLNAVWLVRWLHWLANQLGFFNVPLSSYTENVWYQIQYRKVVWYHSVEILGHRRIQHLEEFFFKIFNSIDIRDPDAAKPVPTCSGATCQRNNYENAPYLTTWFWWIGYISGPIGITFPSRTTSAFITALIIRTYWPISARVCLFKTLIYVIAYCSVLESISSYTWTLKRPNGIGTIMIAIMNWSSARTIETFINVLTNNVITEIEFQNQTVSKWSKWEYFFDLKITALIADWPKSSIGNSPYYFSSRFAYCSFGGSECGTSVIE